MPLSSLEPREARARTRGSTIFETFKAQNAEICTPPRPCPPAPWTPDRPCRARERGNDFRDFQGSKRRNLHSPAPVPPTPWTSRPEPREARARMRGSTTCKAQNAEICTVSASVPPAPWTNWNLERPEHGRGGVRFSRPPPPRAPPRPGPQRGQSTGAGEYDFRDVQGSKCRNLYWSVSTAVPQSFEAVEALVRLPHNIFNVLADAC